MNQVLNQLRRTHGVLNRCNKVILSKESDPKRIEKAFIAVDRAYEKLEKVKNSVDAKEVDEAYKEFNYTYHYHL